MNKVRVGLIGTSWWADLEHLPGLRARADVDIAALCGRDKERASRLAEKFAVPAVYTDWRAMVADAALDVLVISTPNVLHHSQAMAAFAAGLHVICEKPLAMSVAEASAMATRAAATKRVTLTFFTHRALAAAAHIKQLVDSGYIGRLLQVNALYHSSSHLPPDKPRNWRMVRAEAGTGALGDIGSHIIDMVRWWAGDFARVCATWTTFLCERPGGVVDADDACSFLAELKCGATAVVQASKLFAGRGNYQRVELCGTDGVLIYDADPGVETSWVGRVYGARTNSQKLESLPIPAALVSGLDSSDAQANRNTAFQRLVDPFFAAVKQGAGEVSPDFVDGVAVQAVLDAVALSATRGEWVTV